MPYYDVMNMAYSVVFVLFLFCFYPVTLTLVTVTLTLILTPPLTLTLIPPLIPPLILTLPAEKDFVTAELDHGVAKTLELLNAKKLAEAVQECIEKDDAAAITVYVAGLGNDIMVESHSSDGNGAIVEGFKGRGRHHCVCSLRRVFFL